MKKVVLATVLAVSSAMTFSHYAVAQQAAPELPAAEANAFNSAVSLTDPKAQAAALEAFLTQYPSTQVKGMALEQLLNAYSVTGDAKTVPTADALLKVDPNNIRALTMESYLHQQQGQQATDPAAQQAEYDTAAGFAQKGLAALENPPKTIPAEQLQQLKAGAVPLLYSAVATDDMGKKDFAGAIENYKKELAALPEAATTQPGPVLVDVFQLSQAYRMSAAQTPTDFVNCAYYAARAGSFAPEPIKTQMLKTAQYCYQKYHGKLDGFEAIQTAAQAHLNPEDALLKSVTPAPKPSDLAHQALQGADPATLALADREFILQNGTQADDAGTKDSDKVWATMKGKSVTIPDAIVIAAPAPGQLQVAVSDDAQQNKVADVTVTIKPMEEPAAPKAKTPAANAAYKKAQADYAAYQAATAVGGKVTFEATYDSFTLTPTFMITMSNGEVQLPKAAPARPAAGAGRPAAGGARRAPARR